MRRLRKRSGVAGLIALSTLAAAGCSGGHEITLSAAPACPTVKLVRSGNQVAGIDARNRDGSWRLVSALWDRNAPSPIRYPVRSDSWTRGCVYGGTVRGDVPRSWTRDQWYDGEDGGTRLGGEGFRQTLTATTGNYLRVIGSSVSDFEDGFDPNAGLRSATTYLERVHAQWIRDDCVENEDVPHNLVIRDSLFDGCFTGIAERPSGSTSSSVGKGPQRLSIDRSLIYVRPQPLGRNYCDADRVRRGRCRTTSRAGVFLGSYGIWKWSDQAARSVTVRDTIFRMDMPSYSSCRPQKWPPGTYRNVTLVWTGPGAYASAGGCDNRVPSGVRVTRDLSVWTNARTAWLSR